MKAFSRCRAEIAASALLARFDFPFFSLSRSEVGFPTSSFHTSLVPDMILGLSLPRVLGASFASIGLLPNLGGVDFPLQISSRAVCIFAVAQGWFAYRFQRRSSRRGYGACLSLFYEGLLSTGWRTLIAPLSSESHFSC